MRTLFAGGLQLTKKELEHKRKLGECFPELKILPLAKSGRPNLLLGEKLDDQVIIKA